MKEGSILGVDDHPKDGGSVDIVMEVSDLVAFASLGGAELWPEIKKEILEASESQGLGAEDAIFWCARGLAFEEKSHHDEALKSYNEAIRLDLDCVAAFMFRGALYARGENESEARAIRDFSEAIRLQSEGEDRPADSGLYKTRAGLYAGVEDFDKAIEDYDEVIRRNPDDLAALIGRGRACKGKGYHDRAFSDYTEVLSQDPSNLVALFLRGELLFEIAAEVEKYDQALDDFNSLAQLNPELAACEYSGNCHWEKGDLDAAIADFTEAIDRGTEPRVGHNPLTGFFMMLPRSLEIEGADSRVRLYRGICYRDNDDYARARKDLEEVLQSYPEDTGCMALLGNVYCLMGEWDLVIDQGNELLSLAPEDFLGLYMRGVAFNRKGCYESAVEDFSRLIDLDISEEEFSDQPFQPGAFWSKRGYAYKSMGKNAEAAADFKRADELGYEEPEGWQAQPSSDENI